MKHISSFISQPQVDLIFLSVIVNGDTKGIKAKMTLRYGISNRSKSNTTIITVCMIRIFPAKEKLDHVENSQLNSNSAGFTEACIKSACTALYWRRSLLVLAFILITM